MTDRRATLVAVIIVAAKKQTHAGLSEKDAHLQVDDEMETLAFGGALYHGGGQLRKEILLLLEAVDLRRFVFRLPLTMWHEVSTTTR